MSIISCLGENATEVRRLSLAALKLAARHNTPPSPVVYEIWYAYASGENAALNAHVHEVVASEGQLTAEDIHRIHDRFFSTLHLQGGVSDIGSEFDEQLDRVVQILHRTAAAGGDICGSLENLATKLSRATSLDTAGRLVSQIVSLSQRQSQNTRNFGDELLATRQELCALRRELSSLQQSVLLDHLTQLSNRRHFDETIAKEIEASRKSSEPLCLAIADIDHFKAINDQYGHPAGDKILVKLAEIFRRNIKGRDTAARIGGEEFALILPNTSLPGAAGLCERLREYFCAVRFIDTTSGKRLRRATVSFGRMRPACPALLN